MKMSKEYFKEYRLKNAEKIKRDKKLYYQNNREKIKEQHKKYYFLNSENIKQRQIKKNPLIYRYRSIRARCENPKSKDYRWYGGKGIKCLITLQEIETLWKRDNAETMKNPSIDRIDQNGHYVFSNCRFIEQSLNNSRVNRLLKGREKACLS